MIILRKKYIHDKNYSLIDVKLEEKDYGASFADMLGECEIEGHVTSRFGNSPSFNEYNNFTEYIERCEICNLERMVKEYEYDSKILSDSLISGTRKIPTEYGKWKPNTCYECEENFIISRPLENMKCPKCGKIHDTGKDSGILHTNGDTTLLFDCGYCNARDQVIE